MIRRFLLSIFHPNMSEIKQLCALLTAPRFRYAIWAYIRDSDGCVMRVKAYVQLHYPVTWITMKTILRRVSLERVHVLRTSLSTIEGANFIKSWSTLIAEYVESSSSDSGDSDIDTNIGNIVCPGHD